MKIFFLLCYSVGVVTCTSRARSEHVERNFTKAAQMMARVQIEFDAHVEAMLKRKSISDEASRNLQNIQIKIRTGALLLESVATRIMDWGTYSLWEVVLEMSEYVFLCAVVLFNVNELMLARWGSDLAYALEEAFGRLTLKEDLARENDMIDCLSEEYAKLKLELTDAEYSSIFPVPVERTLYQEYTRFLGATRRRINTSSLRGQSPWN